MIFCANYSHGYINCLFSAVSSSLKWASSCLTDKSGFTISQFFGFESRKSRGERRQNLTQASVALALKTDFFPWLFNSMPTLSTRTILGDPLAVYEVDLFDAEQVEPFDADDGDLLDVDEVDTFDEDDGDLLDVYEVDPLHADEDEPFDADDGDLLKVDGVTDAVCSTQMKSILSTIQGLSKSLPIRIPHITCPIETVMTLKKLKNVAFLYF